MPENTGLSDADLERMMSEAAAGKVPEGIEQVPGIELEEEPAEEVAPQETIEPEPTAEEVTEPAAEQEEPAEVSEDEPAEDTEYDPQEELRIALEAERAKRKKFESLAGRHAGKMDFLERRLRDIEQARQSRPVEDVLPDEDREPGEGVRREAPPPRRDSALPDSYRTHILSTAVMQAGADFSANPDHANVEEYKAEMGQYLESIGYNMDDLLRLDDPGLAARETTRALSEAYWHVRGEKETARRLEYSKRRADQTAKLAKAKRTASPSATGNAPPPKPKPADSPDEMSDDELEAALKEVTGGDW